MGHIGQDTTNLLCACSLFRNRKSSGSPSSATEQFIGKLHAMMHRIDQPQSEVQLKYLSIPDPLSSLLLCILRSHNFNILSIFHAISTWLSLQKNAPFSINLRPQQEVQNDSAPSHSTPIALTSIDKCNLLHSKRLQRRL